jgi:hypothetical protein
MWDWIGDHWFQLSAISVLGVGFLLLISLMTDARNTLEAILGQIEGLRADVAQAAQIESPEPRED